MSDIDWKKIGQSIAGAAPVLGGILSGPAGMAVTAAGALASAVLGVDNSPAAVEQAIKSDPEALVKLKQAEMDHKIKLQELVIQREQLGYTDLQNARKRDIEVRKAAPNQDNTRANWMIVGDVIGLIVCLAVLFAMRNAVGEGLGEVRGLITAIAGYFGLGLRDAHFFEFGSSRGSKQKTDAMSLMGGAQK